MNKTDFYKNAIKYILKADPEDMFYYIGERNYEIIINEEEKDKNEAKEFLNNKKKRYRL